MNAPLCQYDVFDVGVETHEMRGRKMCRKPARWVERDYDGDGDLYLCSSHAAARKALHAMYDQSEPPLELERVE